MPVSITLYNHTAKLFANGTNEETDTYRVMLCTSATFNAANATLASVTKTEASTSTGYSAGGGTLANVIVTASSNDAKFDADDTAWNATGGPITASYGILYNDTATDDPPLAFLDFGGSQAAGDGTQFKILWNANGIFSFLVT